MISLEEALYLAQSRGRVCPKPQQWNELYKLLPKPTEIDAGRKPSQPLILAAWHDTSALSKIMRLREHIEWAASHDALDEIYKFLNKLDENEWHHIDD